MWYLNLQRVGEKKDTDEEARPQYNLESRPH